MEAHQKIITHHVALALLTSLFPSPDMGLFLCHSSGNKIDGQRKRYSSETQRQAWPLPILRTLQKITLLKQSEETYGLRSKEDLCIINI